MVDRRGEASGLAWIEGYRAALGASEIGVFRWHFKSDRVEWDETLYRLFRVPPGQRVRCLEDALMLVHPEDRAQVRAAASAAQTHSRIDVQFRCCGPESASHWLWGRGKVFYDAAGKPLFAAGTCQEVAATARKFTLPPTEKLLSHITAAVPVLIAYVDRNLRYQYVSPDYEKWFQRPLEAIQGQPIWEVMGEAAFAAIEPYIKRALAGETVAYTEEIAFRGLGPRYTHVRLIPDLVGKQVGGYSAVAIDLTELQLLSKHQAQLTALVESSTDAIISQDLDGIIQSWNPGAERLYGYTAEEVVGQSMTLLIPAAFQAKTAQILEQIRRGQPVASYETVRLCKDGTAIPVSMTVSPIKDTKGHLAGFSKIARDITERKQAEFALQERQERLNMALMASGTTTYRWDISTNTLQWDENVERFFKLAPGEGARLSTLKGYLELIHPKDRAAFMEGNASCINTGTDLDLEYRIIHSDGTVRWLVDRGKVFRDEVGRSLYVTGACIDITAHKQVEEALREGDRRKNEFLAILAHELRNPLAPIANTLELLSLAGDDPAVITDAVPAAKRQLQQLVRLVDDLLDVSRITRGKIPLRRERLRVETIVQSALDTSKPLMEAGGHTLKVDLPEVPLFLWGDSVRLAQVLSNLLVNAAKYTPLGGEIRLAVHQEGEEVIIRVQDNGVGISAKFLPHLFEMFSQVKSPHEQKGGLGLGLPLVKGLVEQHGGSVEVASEGVGQGSTFTVRLPLETERLEKPGGDKTPPVEVWETTAVRRILVVDDNQDAANTTAAMLQLLRHQVHTAYDGESALEMACVHRPEVVLLDLGMPGMDGWEVARRLRQQPEQADTVLIALTGWGQETDRQRTRDAGFDHHLVKPVDFQALTKLLGEVDSANA